MAYLDEERVGSLWNRISTLFGAKLSISGVTVRLMSGLGSVLSSVTIPDANETSKGVMTRGVVAYDIKQDGDNIYLINYYNKKVGNGIGIDFVSKDDVMTEADIKRIVGK